MLITENLYLGAYALLNGATLERVSLSRSNGRTTAVFELACPQAEQLSAQFFSEAAIVNLAAYRKQLEGLKDELFAALRRNETERRDHDPRPRARHARL